MGFLESGLATTSPEFLLRIQAATFKVAQDILNESADHSSDRHQLALTAAWSPADVVPGFVWLCAANPTIAGTVTRDPDGDVQVDAPDGDLEYVITSNWDTVAGREAP